MKGLEYRKRTRVERKAWVYALWSKSGDCLYIGKTVCSLGPQSRIYVHVCSDPWKEEIYSWSAMEVPEPEILDREGEEISKWSPKYNRQHPLGCGSLCGYQRHAQSVKKLKVGNIGAIRIRKSETDNTQHRHA